MSRRGRTTAKVRGDVAVHYRNDMRRYTDTVDASVYRRQRVWLSLYGNRHTSTK